MITITTETTPITIKTKTTTHSTTTTTTFLGCDSIELNLVGIKDGKFLNEIHNCQNHNSATKLSQL